MLDAVIDYLPSPLDVLPAIDYKRRAREDVEVIRPSVDEPFSALAFKVMDPPVRGLADLRAASIPASSSPATQVTQRDQGPKERMGMLLDALQQGEPGRKASRRHRRGWPA